jgi:bifunctional non-homologous end joining protein LigD
LATGTTDHRSESNKINAAGCQPVPLTRSVRPVTHDWRHLGIAFSGAVARPALPPPPPHWARSLPELGRSNERPFLLGGHDTLFHSPSTSAIERRQSSASFLLAVSLAFDGPRMLLRPPVRPTLAVGFVWPCLPTSAAKPPSGERWLHEIKHDGFRLIARKIGSRVKLYSRSGNDLTYRFPLIVEAVAKLRVRSCIIDGEAVACADDGLSSFDRICYRQNDASVFMWAFDLIELDGDDLRLDRLEARKGALATLLMRAAPGLRLNEHMDEDDGPVVFYHACKLGFEGIVSKHKDSRYHSGRSRYWIKSKNPLSPAVRREAEIDWQRWPR